jgi:hypothetical protein
LTSEAVKRFAETIAKTWTVSPSLLPQGISFIEEKTARISVVH